MTEPCLCGAPDCRRCFPQNFRRTRMGRYVYIDPDAEPDDYEPDDEPDPDADPDADEPDDEPPDDRDDPEDDFRAPGVRDTP